MKNNLESTKNRGEKIKEIETCQSKWGHWNVRVVSFAWIVIEVWSVFYLGYSFIYLIFAFVFIFVLLNIGKRSDWAHLKYIVYSNGIIFARASRWTYKNKPVAAKDNIFKINRTREFVDYRDMIGMEDRKSRMNGGKFILTKSGYKYYVQKKALDQLLPYIEKNMGKGGSEMKEDSKEKDDISMKEPELSE